MARSFKRPDEAAMQRVFARTSGGAAEVVLRLAWLQGLHRAEITALRWDQVDFAGRALLLPDRTIPLDPSAEACLRAWYVRCAGNPKCVAVSDRDQTPMRPESVSRLARQALNSEGLALSLMDLRRDFILRQIETHGWSYAAQVSGVAAAALREEFLPRLRAANTLPEAPKVGRDEREYLLWRIIQQEGSSPAGLALWMGWQLRMQPGEIAGLTWNQVDFARNLLRLPGGGGVHGQPPAAYALGDACPAERSGGRAGVHISCHRAAHGARPADCRSPDGAAPGRIGGREPAGSLRGGQAGGSVPDAGGAGGGAGLAGARRCHAIAGRVPDGGAAAAPAAAGSGGTGARGRAVLPCGRGDAAGGAAGCDPNVSREHGSGRRQDFLRLLNVSPAQGTQILRRLTARGELILTGRRYTLPKGE